jgi:hypothetical protein
MRPSMPNLIKIVTVIMEMKNENKWIYLASPFCDHVTRIVQKATQFRDNTARVPVFAHSTRFQISSFYPGGSVSTTTARALLPRHNYLPRVKRRKDNKRLSVFFCVYFLGTGKIPVRLFNPGCNSFMRTLSQEVICIFCYKHTGYENHAISVMLTNGDNIYVIS